MKTDTEKIRQAVTEAFQQFLLKEIIEQQSYSCYESSHERGAEDVHSST